MQANLNTPLAVSLENTDTRSADRVSGFPALRRRGNAETVLLTARHIGFDFPYLRVAYPKLLRYLANGAFAEALSAERLDCFSDCNVINLLCRTLPTTAAIQDQLKAIIVLWIQTPRDRAEDCWMGGRIAQPFSKKAADDGAASFLK
jgi:hypothetical protein